MNERPELSAELNSKAFLSFYYLKEELVLFCRQQGIPASGGKEELTVRIAHFLDTGEVVQEKACRKRTVTVSEITEDMLIEENIVCSEVHRAFFKEQIGDAFKFYVAFQNWLKKNSGKTYKEAVEAYYVIKRQKKEMKSEIGGQFEYNTYIRDFFADNDKKSIGDAIACWMYKKSKPGHNRYEKGDLIALSNVGL